MSTESDELKLYIDNDANLYRQMTTPIYKNLATKKARGEYSHALAVKAFEHLATEGAKRYAKEHGGPGQPWNVMFSPADRRECAADMATDFEGELKLGNYDHLLPKKYQGGASSGGKKSPAQLQREIDAVIKNGKRR